MAWPGLAAAGAGAPGCTLTAACRLHAAAAARAGREVDKWLGGRLKPTVIEDAAQLKVRPQGRRNVAAASKQRCLT